MPVRLGNLTLWPDNYIPYESDADGKRHASLIQRVNAQLGFEIFKPRTVEGHYAKFVIGTAGDSEMGYHAKSPISPSVQLDADGVKYQKISNRDPSHEWGAVHEMVHCIGLAHEHLHSQYPLTDPGLGRGYLEQERKRGVRFGDVVFRNALASRAKCVDVGPMDPSSIMMYQETWRPLYDRYLERQRIHVPSRTGTPEAKLSPADVAAIKSLYPGPARPTMPDAHPLYDRSYQGPPSGPSAAVVTAQPHPSFRKRLRAALEGEKPIATASGLRIFALGPEGDTFCLIVRAVLDVAEDLGAKGYRLRVTPLVRPLPDAEVRIHYY